MAENTLIDKILALQEKYNSLQAQLSDPAVIADMKKYVQLNKDYKQLEPIVKTGLDYKRKVEELADAKDILINEKDDDLREMVAPRWLRSSLCCPRWRSRLRYCLSLPIRMTPRTPLSRFVAELAVMRMPYSPVTFSGCTPNTLRRKAGSLR